MKRILALLLVLTLMFAAIPLTTSADESDNSEVAVDVDGFRYDAHIGDIIRYTYYLDMSDIELGEGAVENRFTEFEGAVFYNKAGLTLLTEIEGDDGYPVLPNLKTGSIIVSGDSENSLRYNGINLKGYLFAQKKVFLQADFKIVGSENLYINHHIINLGSGSVKMLYCGDSYIAPKTETVVEVGCVHGSYPVGDVDLDNVVTIIDASEIQLWLSGTKELGLQSEINGDKDRDGKTDILDATAIQRRIAGLDEN